MLYLDTLLEYKIFYDYELLEDIILNQIIVISSTPRF